MENEWIIAKRIRTGAICGLAGIACYFLAAFVPLPDMAANVTAFAFGPLLSVSCGGIYYYLKKDQPNFRMIIAVISSIGAGITLLIMLTTQQAIFAALNTPVPGGAGSLSGYISGTSNAVHLGIDIAWDILISIATFLFGLEFFQRKGILKITGVAGMIFSTLLIGFNLFYFPQPPGEVGSIDFGPFVAFWFIWVFILLIVKKRTTHFK